jgi:hypothetical protein
MSTGATDAEMAALGAQDAIYNELLEMGERRTYEQILASKIVEAIPCGFEPFDIQAALFDWQRVIVQWAIRKGRAALFCDTGLGKTPMLLEWSRQVSEHTGLLGH